MGPLAKRKDMSMSNNTLNAAKDVQLNEELSFIQRVSGIVLSPTKVMKNLIQKPRILFPILAIAFGLLLFYSIRFSLYSEFMKYMTIQKNPSVPADQLELSAKIVPIVGLALSPFTSLFNFFVSTTIIFVLAKIFKGQGKYKQYMSVVGYTTVIVLLYYLVNIIMSFITGNLFLDSSLANISNLIAPEIKGTFLYGFLRGVSLFNVWQYCIVGIGTYQLSKLNKPKVIIIVAVAYIVSVLTGVGNFKFM